MKKTNELCENSINIETVCIINQINKYILDSTKIFACKKLLEEYKQEEYEIS